MAATEDESEVLRYLETFTSERNTDVESFLHENAVKNEKRDFTRTSLLIDEQNNHQIIGYFTLLIKTFQLDKQISKRIRKKLTGDKNAHAFNAILIAQLGRSDAYKGHINGDVILEYALENCALVYDLIGLRIVCVEYADIKYLNDFYLKNKFNLLQVDENEKNLAFVRF